MPSSGMLSKIDWRATAPGSVMTADSMESESGTLNNWLLCAMIIGAKPPLIWLVIPINIPGGRSP